MLETDRVFGVFGHFIWRYADEVWVPSHFNRVGFDDVIRRWEPPDRLQYICRPEVVVIPDCLVDSAWKDSPCSRDKIPPSGILSPEERRRAGRPFRFLSTFAAASDGRKGSDVLLRAFFEEFRDDDDVELHIHTTFDEFKSADDHGTDSDIFRRTAANLYREWGYGNVSATFLERIVAWAEQIPLQDMPCEFGKYDAFVLPTRGEGWGLPIMEAMAMGVPVIVTNFSAIPDYVRDEWGYLIPFQLVEATGSFYGRTGGRWALASKDDLRRLMRKVTSDPAEAHLKGLKGQTHVWTHHNERVCAKMALEQLDRIFLKRLVQAPR